MDTYSEIDSVLTQWSNNGYILYIELKIGFLSTMAFHSFMLTRSGDLGDPLEI